MSDLDLKTRVALSNEIEGDKRARIVLRDPLPISFTFVLKRILYALLAVIGALSIVFLLIAASGNPARLMLPEDATEEEVARLADLYGFNEPIYIRYFNFLAALLRGQFPDSIRFNEPSLTLVLERLPATLQLSGISFAIGISFGLLLGYWLATTKNRLISNLVLRTVVVIQVIPPFLLAITLVLIFSVTLHWFPTSGYDTYLHLVLPVITFSASMIPGIARVYRSSLVDAYKADHVLTAIAKGIETKNVRFNHVALNALGPVVTYIGLQIGGILGGAVIVESVFAYPGVGQLLVSSINSKDFPVTLAAVFLISVGYVVTSFFVDIILKIVDPKIEIG